MGWRISALITNSKPLLPATRLAKELGWAESASSEYASLNEVLFPEYPCVGFYNSCTIISHQAFLSEFFNERSSELERKFCRLFGESDMLVVGQIENAGISGFSFISNGWRVRTRLEGEEEGEIINFGRQLDEEAGVSSYDLPRIMSKKILGEMLDSDAVLRTTMSLFRK